MLKRFTTVFLLLLLFNIQGAYSRDRQVLKTPGPYWITEKKADISADTSGASKGGYYYLLIDIQENIPEQTIYCHYAIKLLTSDGVQNMSDINVDFDPLFQNLSFHSIKRIRNGVSTDELSANEIRLIQREGDMERFLYDGRLTAYVNLKDVRAGDILEYSYSVKGYNPIYKGKYFKTVYFEYNDPIREIYRRLIAPKSLNLITSSRHGNLDPEIGSINGNSIYTWTRKNTPVLIYDNNVPSWYNANLRVQISSCPNWGDVNELIRDNYRVPDAEMKKLEGEAKELFGKITNRDSLIVQIIRFVQDDIRYLGFESGMNNYRPIGPVKVMELRYADCKAKSLLLCSLLKIFGIEASPVLVNSNKIKDPTELLPTPDAFNHCITLINFDGQLFFIDPTISSQGGTAGKIYFPDYGYGLVLKEGKNELTMTFNLVQSETRVENLFMLSKVGGPASYRVITEYTGTSADVVRGNLISKSIEEVSSDYLKYYSKTYPSVRMLKQPVYSDDRNRNIIRVEEQYTIDSIWTPLEGEPDKLELTVTALEVNSATSIPSSPQRKMPYQLAYTTKYTENIEIYLPESWLVHPKSVEIKDSAFLFSYSSSLSGKKITLNYTYRTLKDFIEAEGFREFYAKHKKIADYLNYQLTYNRNLSKPFAFSNTVAFACLVLIGFFIFLAVRIYYRYDTVAAGKGNEMIGSWLVLVAIGLVISSFRLAWDIFFGNNFFNANTWSLLAGTGKNSSLLLMLFSFEFIYNVGLLVYIILLQILFYKRRTILPRLIIIFYIVNLAATIFDTFAAQALSPGSFDDDARTKSYTSILQSLLVATIWVLYFVKSERVKRTFTRRLKGDDEKPVPPESGAQAFQDERQFIGS